jgi:Cystathionine beta-lyases/cystathionine gamma-synthases
MDHFSQMLLTPSVSAENEPLCQPIYQTSLFQMPSYEEAIRCENTVHPSAYYTRWGNPTVSFLENQLLAISGYEKALIFPSGMSAITTTLLSLIKAGDTLFASNRLYGDTLKFFVEELPRFGVEVTFFDILDLDTLADLPSGQKATFIYFEALSNPDLVLADLGKIKEIAQSIHATTICDATFTPPGNLQIHSPDFIDIAIHSLTKYISGHFSSFGGAVLCAEATAEKIWHTQALYGACMDPHASWLISQGLKTLHLRLQHQNTSALSIAEYLESHPKIQFVRYPLLESYPQYVIANQLLNNGGGVISFSLKGSKSSAIQLIENTQLIGLFVSLGGIHSCIEHAQSMSHSMVNHEHKKISQMDNTTEDLIRLSIGIEKTEDIINDLDQALKKVSICSPVESTTA